MTMSSLRVYLQVANPDALFGIDVMAGCGLLSPTTAALPLELMQLLKT